MEANIGKTLREARLARGLSVEDAAQHTRIPKARIIDLENDDYSRFPSLAYARGFLALYARFLNVDRSRYATVDVGSPVAMTDYHYMQKDESMASLHLGPKVNTPPPSRKLWLKRIAIFGSAITVGIISAMAILQWNRLPSIDQLIQLRETPTPAVVVEATPTPEPTPIAPETASATESDPALDEALGILGTEHPAPALPQEAFDLPEAQAPPSPDGEPTPLPPTAPVNASAEVAGPPPDSADLPPLPPELPVREIKVSATKRTRVKIYRDDAQGEPVYNNWIRRGGSISLKGRYFWIETSDRKALKITSAGKPVSTAPGANNSAVSGIELK